MRPDFDPRELLQQIKQNVFLIKKPENLNHKNDIKSIFLISSSLSHPQSKKKLKIRYVNVKAEMLGMRSNKHTAYTERVKQRERERKPKKNK